MDNQENKVYKIYEILSTAAMWLDDPTNEENASAFNDLKSNLIIKEYMPLNQKELCIKRALLDMNTDKEVTPHTASIVYEVALMFDCLLAYIVNLDYSDINTIFKETYYYDLLVLSGLRDYILSFCEKDYKTMEKLADRMIAFDNLQELTSTLQSISPDQIDRLTKEIAVFKTVEGQDILKSLAQIAAMDDPLLNSVKETIEDAAYKTALSVDNAQKEEN